MIDQGHGRAQLADGEVAANHAGADHAGPVGVEIGKLTVVRLGLGADHGQGDQPGQADDEDADRVLDHQVSHPEPEPGHACLLQALLLGIGTRHVMRRLEGPEDRAAQPGQQDRGQRECRHQGDGQTQGDRGPRVLDLGEAREVEHPQADDDRPRAGDQRAAHLDDRLAQGVMTGSAARQFFPVPGDEEEAVVGAGTEEHDDHRRPA